MAQAANVLSFYGGVEYPLLQRLGWCVRLSFEPRVAKAVILDLSQLGLFFNHLSNDPGCLVHLRLRFGDLCFRDA